MHAVGPVPGVEHRLVVGEPLPGAGVVGEQQCVVLRQQPDPGVGAATRGGSRRGRDSRDRSVPAGRPARRRSDSIAASTLRRPSPLHQARSRRVTGPDAAHVVTNQLDQRLLRVHGLLLDGVARGAVDDLVPGCPSRRLRCVAVAASPRGCDRRSGRRRPRSPAASRRGRSLRIHSRRCVSISSCVTHRSALRPSTSARNASSCGWSSLRVRRQSVASARVATALRAAWCSRVDVCTVPRRLLDLTTRIDRVGRGDSVVRRPGQPRRDTEEGRPGGLRLDRADPPYQLDDGGLTPSPNARELPRE